jgi:hemolysin activation/secretion protein
MSMRALVILCATSALSALVLASTAAQAQDFDRIAPKQPKAAATAQLTVPSQAHITAAASTRTILASLKGLRFVASPAAIVKNGVHQSGVTVAGQGLQLLRDPGFVARLGAGFLGKPLSLADLNAIAERVKARYRRHGLPLVSVTFPAQDISSGTVQAVVTVYRLGRVHISHNGDFSKSLIRSEMQLKPGDPLNIDRLRLDLNRLSRNPFHPVSVVLAKGAEPGQTDLDLDLHARFPLRVYAAYDNYGEAVTGRDRYSVGFNVSNLLGLDEQLSYQYMTSPDLWQSRHRAHGLSNAPRFTAHSLSFLTPLPWGDFLNVFGAYEQMVPNLGPNFGQRGHNVELGVRYIHDLLPIGAISHQISIGFDFKRSDNNLAYGGVSVYGHTANVEQFSISYAASRPDSEGQTALTNTLVLSPGGLSNGNTTRAFEAYGTVGAHASYVYDRLELSRVNALAYGFTAYVHAEAQIASTELLPSEQLGAGGPDSVRGYDPRQVNGSNGVLASFEVRSPSFSVLHHLDGRLNDDMQLLAFYDFGNVAYQHAQPYLPRSATLQSVGIGARYIINHLLEARFDDGWQLNKAPGAKALGNLATVSLVLSY